MVKSASRILDILEFVSARRGGATHGEIASGIGIPKSSVTALLLDLTKRSYLMFDRLTGRFQLGPQLLSLASVYLHTLDVVTIGQAIVRETFTALDEFTALAIPQGMELVNVCAETPHYPMAHSVQIGERLPLHSTASGKAWLAFLPDGPRAEMIGRLDFRAYASNTIRDPKTLESELAKVRKTGVAWHHSENIEGITAVAVCIFDARGHPVAALSVAAPSVRFDKKMEKRVLAALVDGGNKLSQRLGRRPAQK